MLARLYIFFLGNLLWVFFLFFFLSGIVMWRICCGGNGYGNFGVKGKLDEECF